MSNLEFKGQPFSHYQHVWNVLKILRLEPQLIGLLDAGGAFKSFEGFQDP